MATVRNRATGDSGDFIADYDNSGFTCLYDGSKTYIAIGS